MQAEKVAYEVTCLNCGRNVATLEQTARDGSLRLCPMPYHEQVQCELRAGTLRCTRCGGRAFVEGLSRVPQHVLEPVAA